MSGLNRANCTGLTQRSSAFCRCCCGALAGDARCWCASLPALPVERLDAASGCLCAACLEADIRRTEEGA
jgi:hypothetical protein